MSGEKINAYLGLIGDMEDKIASLENIVDKIHFLGQEISRITNKIPEEKLMALAGYLHHFYTGTEDVLARIIKTVDGYMSGTGDWHAELLYISSRKTPGIRPAIISAEMHEILADYKAFRHLYRHAYAKELRWKKWTTWPLIYRMFGMHLRKVSWQLLNSCKKLSAILRNDRNKFRAPQGEFVSVIRDTTPILSFHCLSKNFVRI